MNTHRGVGRTKVYLRTLAASCGIMAALAAFPADGWSQPRGFVYQTVLNASKAGAGNFNNPTVVTFAPDGRLFVAQRDGRIFAATLDSGYNVSGTVTEINTIYSLGTTPPGRLVTGMTFGPGGDLFVSHSDVRQDNIAIPITSGQVTRLYAATGFTTYLHVATGLPRSKHDHASNGLAFKPGTNLLYLAQGGMTNAGSENLTPGNPFDDFPEMPQSGTVLEIDVAALTTTVYARGFRNPYDLAWHSNGNLYLNDNGANAGPDSGPEPDPGTCLPNYASRPATQDELNIVLPGQFYGHPNPGEGYCALNGPGTVFPYHYYGWNTSSNGIAEYNSSKIPALKGKLVTANWTTKNIVAVNPTGTPVQTTVWPVSGTYAPFPLDVAVNPRGGGIFVAEYSPSAISVLRVKQPAPLDYDGDGRSDLVVRNPTTGVWNIRYTGTGTTVTTAAYGGPSSIPVAIDFNGDGSAERAVWNPPLAAYEIAGIGTYFLGNSTARPITGDIDGDGLTDLATLNTTTGMWQIRATKTGAISSIGPWGTATHTYVADPYGSGVSHPVSWDPGTGLWHWYGVGIFNLGAVPGDTPLLADIDNDGLTDFCTFNGTTGMWRLRSTKTGVTTTLGPWGSSAVVPYLLDWNGTGSASPAYWDPAGGKWEVYGVGTFFLGSPGDVPATPGF